MDRQLPHFRRAVISAHFVRRFKHPVQQRHEHADTISAPAAGLAPLAWDERALVALLGRVRHLQERLLDRTQSLDFEVQQQVTLLLEDSAYAGAVPSPQRTTTITWTDRAAG